MHFVFGIALARLLLPADFGLIVTIQIFTGFAGYLASGGTGEALVQAKEVRDSDFNVAFTVQFAAGALIFATFYLTSPWFARWFNHPVYIDLLRVSALSFLIRPFVGLARVQLRRAMRFRLLALVDLGGILVSCVASVAMALWGMGPWSLILSGLIGSVISGIVLTSVTRWRPAFETDLSTAKRLGAYGFKVSAAELVGYFRWQASNFVVSRVLGATVVGLYNKADSLSKMPLDTVSNAVYQPVFSALSKIQDNHDQSRYVYLRTITLLSVYTMPMYLGLMWIADPFVGLVYGAKWAASAEPLRVLALAGLAFCVGHPAGAVLAAQNWLGRELYVQLTALSSAVLGCVVGVHWGMIGVAWGMLAAHYLSAWHITWLVRRCIAIRFRDVLGAAFPALLLSTIMIAALTASDRFLFGSSRLEYPYTYIIVTSLLGAVVYAMAFLYLPLPALHQEARRWKRILGVLGSKRA